MVSEFAIFTQKGAKLNLRDFFFFLIFANRPTAQSGAVSRGKLKSRHTYIN